MKDNITKIAIKKEIVFPFAKNIWVFTEKGAREIKKIEDSLTNMLEKYGFKRWITPILIPTSLFQNYGPTDIKPYETNKDMLLDPLALGIYHYLSCQKENKFPFYIYENRTVFRQEKQSQAFCTSDEFRRIDAFFFDSRDRINTIYKILLDNIVMFLDKKQLRVKVKTHKSNKYQKHSEIIIITSDKRELEVVNLAVVNNLNLKKYEIPVPDRIPVHSGYCSIGINRLFYCLLDKKFSKD